MNNVFENAEQVNSLAYLDREEDWEKKIAETTASYDWHITDLLGHKEIDKIETELAFKDIPAAERAIYAATASRLALGFMNYSYEGSGTEEKSRFEMNILRDKIAGHNPDLTSFLHMLCFHLKREADSNAYGAADHTFSKVISDAAVNAAKAGESEMHDSLMNPFHLETGTEILKFNKATGEIENFVIEVLIENGDGIIFFGPGENDYEDIVTFNRKLSLGEYMKRDGDNVFGGLGYLKDRLGSDELIAGKIIKTDVKMPFDDEPKIEEVEIVKTNQPELEQKYGNAYLAFLGSPSRNKKILTVSFKSAKGELINDCNFSDLKIVKEK
ncbi:MAG TPA: hypothetical protein VMD74_03240 [Candidatus Methylomirabilis sp.]|nr:hypothetical protein [Candidatus Methylomirabilis sp.]